MKQIMFEIPGEPKSLARHNTRVVKTRDGKVFLHEYDPPENASNKACIRYAAHAAMQAHGFDRLWLGPLELNIMFWKLQPNGKRIKNPARIPDQQLLARSFPVTRPDVDNMVKLVCDALTGVVWNDDTQVCSIHVHKRYCTDRPRTIVTVRELELNECGEPLGIQNELPFFVEAQT